ncbi:MAG: hypothetical protein FD123_419 [Bacteroidetes bacterium]|nr:MAG: hypothetical protein FD123_419 [Bacteroidota bacterium]
MLAFIIAIVTVFYTLAEKRRSERRYHYDVELQWLREIVIIPNLPIIEKFYSGLYLLEGKLGSHPLNPIQKAEIRNIVDAAYIEFYRAFISLLYGPNKKFGEEINSAVFQMKENIIEIVQDDNYDLSKTEIYKTMIETKIMQSRADLIKAIFEYKHKKK